MINTDRFNKPTILEKMKRGDIFPPITPIKASAVKWEVLLNASYACNANCIYCENHAIRDLYKGQVMTEDIAR